MELKCYVSYFSWRYHLNEILYSISGNNKRKFLKLWFWIEQLQVIFPKEVSFEWTFILISANNKNKFVKFWFGIEVVCVIFLKVVSLEWNFILISAKNKHKIDKCWFWMKVLCVIFLKEVFFEWNFILISPKIKHKIEKILILNGTVMCHISQGGIFWITFHTNFSQK